jgi:Secretion system C-terminal sorting domain
MMLNCFCHCKRSFQRRLFLCPLISIAGKVKLQHSDKSICSIIIISLYISPKIIHMKKYTLLILMGLMVLFAKGQNAQFKDLGDTLGPYTIISFEESTPYITILPIPQNIWQIGAPHKTFFNAAYTPPNVIVTDTVNYYPVNNTSSFELIVGNFNTQNMYPSGLFIDFHHKYDSDSLTDGGYITVSWDNGQTWTNIIDDTANFYMVTPAHPWFVFGNNNLYDTSSILINGQHGFTGHSGNWIHSCMAWYDLRMKKQNHPADGKTGGLPDTLRLRFNFVSDGIQQNHEGWMIDQIRIFGIDQGTGIQEYLTGRSHSYFFPNPVKTTASFTMNKTYRNVHYEILDSRGALVSKNDRGTCDEFTFDCTGISPGIYFMKLYLDNQFTDIHRIIIAP